MTSNEQRCIVSLARMTENLQSTVTDLVENLGAVLLILELAVRPGVDTSGIPDYVTKQREFLMHVASVRAQQEASVRAIVETAEKLAA